MFRIVRTGTQNEKNYTTREFHVPPIPGILGAVLKGKKRWGDRDKDSRTGKASKEVVWITACVEQLLYTKTKWLGIFQHWKKKKRKEFVRRGEQWEQPSPPNNSTSDKNQLDSLFWSKNLGPSN